MGRQRGRGNYPHDFKRQVVAETLVAGATVTGVSRRHGLNANMVFQWCKDDRFQPAPDPTVLLPVEVVGAVDERQPIRPIVARVEITTRSGHRLVVTDSEDPTAIANLVRALEAV
ncbi:IS66-like element accessory protein TnpA [Meridianimarinicoccus marinus]|uniref:IS66-like element accessory protein TnpA n=1 Tax=Meridianimarinicoccus marinus TaxID=3231483 RepID=UPI003F4E9809